MSDPRSKFLQAVQDSLTNETLIALVLTNPKDRSADVPRKQSVRPVQIRGQRRFQWELQFERQQTHLNLDQTETASRLELLFPETYRNANLFTVEADLIASCTPRSIKLRRQPASRVAAVELDHNRRKDYLIPEGRPCGFLHALGVMTEAGQVKQSRQKKFRQINRYLEMVNDIYDRLPPTGTLRVIDFGCGLSYLTFALHHLLTAIHQRDVEMVGIDQNEHVISRCRNLSAELNLQGMVFQSKRIEPTAQGEPIDLAVSLHACDTATDHALAFAVNAGARVILAAPCCQHELSRSIEAAPLEELLRHGVLTERLSALATDALRGCALEAVGYRTQILEFIDLEHTPKNLLLRAVRREQSAAEDKQSRNARDRYENLKSFLGIRSLASDLILSAMPLEAAGRDRTSPAT